MRKLIGICGSLAILAALGPSGWIGIAEAQPLRLAPPPAPDSYQSDFAGLADPHGGRTVKGAVKRIGVRVDKPRITRKRSFDPARDCARGQSMDSCFQARIDNVKSGTRLKVAKGVYKFNGSGSSAFLTVRGKTDVALNFSGSTLLFGAPRDGIAVWNGTRVQFSRVRIGWSIPVHARGKITSNSTVTVPQPGPGSPIDPNTKVIAVTPFDFTKGSWSDLGGGVNNRAGESTIRGEARGDSVVYTGSANQFAGPLKKGATDVIVRYYGKLHAVVVEGDPAKPGPSNDISFRKVRVRSSPSMGFKVNMGYGSGFKIFKSRIAPLRRARFRDGTPNYNRYISSNIDAVNIENASDVSIRRSRLIGMGDDGVNSHAILGQVSKVEGRAITVARSGSIGNSKSFVAFSSDLTYLGRFGISSTSGGLVTSEQDLARTLKPGDYVAGYESFPSRYRISKNRIADGLARGLLLYLPNGAVRGNRISNMGSPGIILREEIGTRWDRGGRLGAPVNIRISRNRFTETDAAMNALRDGDPSHRGAISLAAVVDFDDQPGVTTPDYPVFSGILIQGNRFSSIVNPYDVSVVSGRDITLARNSYSRSRAVGVEKSSGVTDCGSGKRNSDSCRLIQ
ncbi:MAG: hypothetical protein ACRCYU_13230 [Nocardioides sp.]